MDVTRICVQSTIMYSIIIISVCKNYCSTSRNFYNKQKMYVQVTAKEIYCHWILKIFNSTIAKTIRYRNYDDGRNCCNDYIYSIEDWFTDFN